MHRQHRHSWTSLTIGVLLFASNGIGSADSLTVTNTFAPNTPATAASVNQNFDDVESSVNDNFSRIMDNATSIGDLNSDVTDLQAGFRPTDRTFIDVDCTPGTGNPDAFLQPPLQGTFTPYTTFNITGDCNGPVFASSPGIRLVGAEPNRGASIVLPNPVAPPNDPSSGAVFADGAHDLRIENLTIDVSQWGSFAVAQGTDAAGVYARNAFVRLIDVDIVGGLYGVNPFRNAIIRTQGTVNINEFINEGITTGDQSLVGGRGQVNISSTRTDGNYMNGVGAYRSGVADFRAGLVVTVPAVLDNTGTPNALESGDHSVLRVRNSGTINIVGAVSTYRKGIVDIDGGTVSGNINIGGGGRADISGVTQPTGHIFLNQGATLSAFNNPQLQGFSAFDNSVVTISGNTTIDGEIEVDRGSALGFYDSTQLSGFSFAVRKNSSATSYDSTIGGLYVDMGSTLELSGTSFEGGEIDRVSVASIFDSSTSQNLTVDRSFMDYSAPGPGNYLNGNTVFECNAISSFVDPNVTASGTVTSTCPP